MCPLEENFLSSHAFYKPSWPAHLQWLVNYLDNRHKGVVVNGETWSSLPSLSGVLQGSWCVSDRPIPWCITNTLDMILLHKLVVIDQYLFDLSNQTLTNSVNGLGKQSPKISQWTQETITQSQSMDSETVTSYLVRMPLRPRSRSRFTSVALHAAWYCSVHDSAVHDPVTPLQLWGCFLYTVDTCQQDMISKCNCSNKIKYTKTARINTCYSIQGEAGILRCCNNLFHG